jgi:phosphotransferase system  glucose/maltose/N-acetylglucosamine-specific IIC component
LGVGAISTYVLYTQKDWMGYIGGLIFATFWMSIIPLVLHNATTGFDTETRSGTAKTYTGAFFILILLLLANVWTVAYAFVPGGVYLRERTDL